MIKQNKHKKIASGILAALMLTSSVQPSVLADQAKTYTMSNTMSSPVSFSAAGSALDFSYAGASSVREIGIAELIARATGTAVSAEEAAYLNSLGFTMRYDEGLSSGLISVSAAGNDLLFKASDQTYQAYNGATVRWAPVSVTVDGKTIPFAASPSGYTATVSGLTKDKVYTADFVYQTTITVSSYALSTAVNRTYSDAQSAIAQLDAYEAAKLAYEEAYVSYQAALKEYETLYANYQTYQNELKQYHAALALYNAYMKKVSAYEAAMTQYQAYLEELHTYDERYAAYEAELAALPEKQAQYEKYLEYLTKMQSEISKLGVLNSCFIYDSMSRSMYTTLMGNTVAQVMAQKDTLVNMAGASAADIDNAGDSTAILQSLLSQYRTISGTEAQLQWYASNYSSLKSNFIMLYSSLYNLGSNVAVRRKLKQEGKWERYAQFVAQLYIISTGFDDFTTFDVNWEYADFGIYSLIEECQRVLDNNSYAPGESLPEKVDPVEKPSVPIAPKKPSEVSEPVKTWTEEVKNPGKAPDPMTEPKKPTLNDFTSGAPQIPAISTELQAAVALVRSGKLTQRTGAIQDISMTFTASFSKSASISADPVVTFYAHDGKTVLLSLQLKKGGNAVYSGQTPVRAEDARASYVFAGWVDALGNAVNLNNIQENVSVYASFTEQLKEYTVVWYAEGSRLAEIYKYGEMPQYTGDPSYRDGAYEYTFTGWSPSLSAVTGDAVYTAQYTKRALDSQSFSVIFKVRGEDYYRTFAYGTMPVFHEFEQDYVSGGYRYVFKGWSPAFEQVTEDAVYEAIFEKTFLIPAGENGTESADMELAGNTYIVTTNETAVDASYAVKEALKSGTQLVLNLGGATITISQEALAKMPHAVYFRLFAEAAGDAAPRAQGAADEGMNYIFSITDKNGNPISFDSEVLVELPISEADANGGRLNAYINGKKTSVSVQDGSAYLRLTESGKIRLCPYYSVTVLTNGNGDVTPEKETAEAGTFVKLNTYLEQGWEIKTLYASVSGGKEELLTLTDGAFMMPAGDVSIRAEVSEAEYTVIFIVNGEEISREIYHYGDEVKVPSMDDKLVYKSESGDKTYTFSGWDSAVSRVTKSITYTAVYGEGTLGDKDNTYISEHDSNKLITVVLPIVLGVLTLGIAAVVWLACKKRNRKNGSSSQKKTKKQKLNFKKIGLFFQTALETLKNKFKRK